MNERTAHQQIAQNAQWIADNVIAMRRPSAPKRNDLHRYCIDGPYRKREPMSLGLRLLVAALFIGSALLVFAFFGFVYQELKMVDWSSVIELMGVKT